MSNNLNSHILLIFAIQNHDLTYAVLTYFASVTKSSFLPYWSPDISKNQNIKFWIRSDVDEEVDEQYLLPDGKQNNLTLGSTENRKAL